MTSGQSTPSQSVQSAFSAFSDGDWRTFASLVHPDALAAFRTSQLGSTVGYTLVKRDPTMRNRNIAITPSEFISADAIQRAKDFRIAEFSGNPTIGELAALSPNDFLVRWCVAATGNPDRPWRAFQHVRRHILGEILEGDTLAHVLYRQEVKSVWLAGALYVMPLKLFEGQWLLLLNDDVIWDFPLVRLEE